MSTRDQIQLNVLFVPGTVHRLAPFILSILESSPACSLRLVSNACHVDEDRILNDVACTDQRLSFVRIGTQRPLSHGSALTMLQKQETSPVFAFMDSDIFATGDFLQELNWSPSRSSALFSCPPVWSNPELEQLPEGFGVLSGVYNQLHDGFCVGSSYFAMYDNNLLTQCMKQTGVSFEYSRWTQLSEQLRRELKQAGKQLLIYDTGKLLNILLQLRCGADLGFRRTGTLEHIGGISGCVLKQPRNLVRMVLGSASSMMPRAGRVLCWRAGMHYGWRDLACEDEIRRIEAENQLKRHVYRYFLKLLRSFTGTTDPQLEFTDENSTLVSEVRRVAARLNHSYPHWHQCLGHRMSGFENLNHADAESAVPACLKVA